MAGRNHLQPSRLVELREVPLPRGHPPPSILIEDPRLRRVPPPAAIIIEERISAHQREIQALLIDNQHLAATHVALKQDLSLVQQELRHLAAAAQEVKNERDAEVRQVYERSLKFEAEVRVIEALKAELREVRNDVEKLTAIKQELTAKSKAINADLARAKSELQDLPEIKGQIEAMRQELQKGRAAVEFEKKTHAANLEQGRAMERNMVSMAGEIDKLRAELANAEKRARAAAAAAAAANPSPAFVPSYGNPGMAYGGSSYSAQYGTHQVEVITHPAAQYGLGAGGHGSFDMQQAHLQR
ncbi:hypothetical protein Dimus_009037 [Dionaea muscipula]